MGIFLVLVKFAKFIYFRLHLKRVETWTVKGDCVSVRLRWRCFTLLLSHYISSCKRDGAGLQLFFPLTLFPVNLFTMILKYTYPYTAC